ncbi:MAG TPA: tripartite tricarboxylate transporter substrate-binding protein [candidate division Zixibacteria bacterium]|nr:tripartite tricarboxylate transporter substrate-binding protein [candidate division Zixibacteria bacterium]
MGRASRFPAFSLSVALLGWAGVAFAQDGFFAGKTIRVIVGFSAGGGFDAYSRTIGRHLGKHVPGNPSVIVENMTGAGSMIAANHVYNQAKPDGLTIGNWIGGLILQQLLGAKGIAFDAAKFEYIGAPVRINNACVTTRKSGITDLSKWRESKTPVKIGAEAAGSTTSDIPRLLMEYTDLPIQLIEGYKGVADVRIAAEGGEVAGFCSSWEGTKTSWRNVIERKDATVVLQASQKPHPDHPKVPLAIDQIKSQEGRDLFKLVVHDVGGTINRLYVLPPGTPKDRVRTLQQAFEKTMNDPEFLAEAKKIRLDIDPVSGEEIAKTVSQMKAIPPGTLAKLKSIILPGK